LTGLLFALVAVGQETGPEAVSAGEPQEAPEAISEEVPREVPEGVPPELLEAVWEELPNAVESEVSEEVPQAGYVSPYDPLNNYLDAIDRIEMEYGPYATELSDLYLGLGHSLLTTGDFERARDAFHRGVMVVRVNEGPNSPEQTNHLYLLANIEEMLGDPGNAEEVVENIQFINSHFYGEENPEMLAVLERMFQWYSMMRPAGSPLTDHKDYDRRIELAEEMVRITEAAYGMGHPKTSESYRRLGEAEFQALHSQLSEPLMLTPEEHVTILTGTSYTLGGLSSGGDHFDSGRRAYRKYLDSLTASESTTALEYAEALANLGDWYLAFDKPRRSRQLYEEAYEVLAQSEQYAQLAEGYMAEPRPVYFVGPQLDLLEELPVELRDLSIDISMTVTTFGDAHYVELVNPPEWLTKDQLGAIRKWVRDTPFRPAMKEGEVVTTKGFIWQYAIAPQGQAS
jgi:tetratricopeptide (TPR) repeat protein